MLENKNPSLSSYFNPILDGPLLPALLKFAAPVLLALFLQALYGAVDLWMVGRFCGPADVSAVATGSQSMLIVTGFITGLSMGTTVLLGQRMGEGNDTDSANVIGSSLCIFLILSIGLTVLMVFTAPYIAVFMHAPEESFYSTIDYIRICGAGTISIVAYNLISAIFRGMGNSKAPLLFVFIACTVNIMGDFILIRYFHMGTAGAAVATIAAQAVSVLISIFYIKTKGLPFTFTKANLKPDRKTVIKVLSLGSPIALQDTCNEFSFIIIMGLVNTLGVTASAGVGIAERIVMFILLIPMSYMSSISAFVAQNIGAGQKERALRSMWLSMSTASVLGGITAYISFFHGDMLSSIFINDTSVIMASAEFLKATAIECFILSIAYCFTGYFNGIGKTAFVMAQGLAGTFLVRIPIAYFATTRPEPKLFNIGLSATLTAAFTLLACVTFYIVLNKKHRPLDS